MISKICKYCDNQMRVYPSKSERLFCSQKCYGNWRSENIKGAKHPMWEGGKITRKCIICSEPFTFDKGYIKRRKGKLEKRFCSVICKAKWQRENNYFKGTNNPRWKGGITPLNMEIRQSNKNKEWIISIFERDNYICQECGKNGGYLHAHHIIPFNSIIKQHNIKNIKDSLNCHTLWDITNGITLCKKCHYNLHKVIN